VRSPVVSLLFFAVTLTGCQCNRSSIPTVEGEVRWQWQTAAGELSDETAVITFADTDMGGRREQVLYVQNVGRAAFTMAEFAKISGSAVTLGALREENSAFEVVWDPEVVVNPSERTGITVRFSAPVSGDEPFAEYSSQVELRPSGAAPAQAIFKGKALAPECFVPETIDFGSIPVRTYVDATVSLRNMGMGPVKVTAGAVTGAPEQTFLVTGIEAGGSLMVAPGTSPEAMFTFRPTMAGDYEGAITLRRSDACPVRTAKLIGRGVKVCLTWSTSPPDPDGNALNFGNVFPGGAGPGTVTLENNCTLGVQVAQLETSDRVFSLAGSPVVSSLVVSPATRGEGVTWVPGTAMVGLEFRPTALGLRTGQLTAITSAAWQPDLIIDLKGYGGGPRIEVEPAPIAMGRMGFTAGASPQTFAQRMIAVKNVGTLPMPADAVMNLHLGMGGQGPTFSSVRAISGGTADELCLGEWDTVTDTCAGTLGSTGYDAALGIVAMPSGVIQVPLRVVPKTPGLKEWELTLYSNDSVTPAYTARVTAEAMAAPPCQYTVSPGVLDFGNIESPEVRDLGFTLTNTGVAPSDVCYFNNLALTPVSYDAFALPGVTSDFALDPGQIMLVVVRAEPLRALPMPTVVSGEVLFNVSKPGASQGSVALDAVIAPTCITFTPSPLAFANTELECAAAERSVVISNNCGSTVELKGTLLSEAAKAPVGSGSCTTVGGCAQFNVIATAATGPIPPGQKRTVVIDYRPYLLGPASGELTITMQQGSVTTPYVVRLSGNGIARTHPGCGLTAVCPSALTVNANTTVTLSPTVMASGATTCAWSVGSRPSTSSGTFSMPSSCTSTSYFADVVGTHLVNFDVADSAGGSASCSTQITVNPIGDLWVELTWDRPADMDLHLLHPNAGDSAVRANWKAPWDCSFQNLRPTWNAMVPAENPSLDRDNIGGRGPENTRIDSPSRVDLYTVGVHSFNANGAPVLSTVKIYCGGSLISTRTKTIPLSGPMWVVGTIDFNSAGTSCVFTPIDTTL